MGVFTPAPDTNLRLWIGSLQVEPSPWTSEVPKNLPRLQLFSAPSTGFRLIAAKRFLPNQRKTAGDQWGQRESLHGSSESLRSLQCSEPWLFFQVCKITWTLVSQNPQSPSYSLYCPHEVIGAWPWKHDHCQWDLTELESLSVGGSLQANQCISFEHWNICGRINACHWISCSSTSLLSWGIHSVSLFRVSPAPSNLHCGHSQGSPPTGRQCWSSQDFLFLDQQNRSWIKTGLPLGLLN